MLHHPSVCGDVHEATASLRAGMDAISLKDGKVAMDLQDAGPSISSVEICMQPGCRKGYVWDAEGAVKLRRHFSLLGSFLGGVATFKSQVAVEGLPLELGLDEVVLAVKRGWAHISPPTLADLSSFLTAKDREQPAGSETNAPHAIRHKKRKLDDAEELEQPVSKQGMHSMPTSTNDGHRPWTAYLTPPNLKHVHWLAEYYAYCEAAGLYGSEPCDTTRTIPASMEQSHSQPVDNEVDDDMQGVSHIVSQVHEMTPSGLETILEPPEWKAAVQDGASFTIPWTSTSRIASNRISKQNAAVHTQDTQPSVSDHKQGCIQSLQPQGMEGQQNQPQNVPAVVNFPANQLESIRHTVFQDLHSKGYAMSAGPKFGCDMLAYPGDPSLYHAQFTVRILEPDQVINPMALKGAARGSHAARKHMLFGTVLPGNEQEGSAQPMYLTFAPEAGFGK